MQGNRYNDANTKGNNQNLENQTASMSASVSSITETPKMRPSSPKISRSSSHKHLIKMPQGGQLSSNMAVSSKTVLQALGMKVTQLKC